MNTTMIRLPVGIAMTPGAQKRGRWSEPADTSHTTARTISKLGAENLNFPVNLKSIPAQKGVRGGQCGKPNSNHGQGPRMSHSCSIGRPGFIECIRSRSAMMAAWEDKLPNRRACRRRRRRSTKTHRRRNEKGSDSRCRSRGYASELCETCI